MIPYRKYDLNFVVETLRHLHQEDSTPTQTIEAISQMRQDEAIELQYHQLHDFEDIFEQALAKLSVAPQIKDLLPQQDFSLDHAPVAAVLDFISHYQSPLSGSVSLVGSSAERLALDFFFLYQEGHYFLRHFLFGTASQKQLPSRGG